MPAPSKQITADELEALGGQQAIGGALRKFGPADLGMAFGTGSLAAYTGTDTALAMGVGGLAGLKGADAVQHVLHNSGDGAIAKALLKQKGLLKTPSRVLEYVTRPGVRGMIGKTLLGLGGAGAGYALLPSDKPIKMIV